MRYRTAIWKQLKQIARVIKKLWYIISRLYTKLFDRGLTDKSFLKTGWRRNNKYANREGTANYIRPWSEHGLSGGAPKEFPNKVSSEIIRKAEKVVSNRFNIMGVENIYFPNSHVEWHCDFKTGYCWESCKDFRDIEIPEGIADIKIPWELSRFQFLPVLGQAYKLTGDEKYAVKFVDLVNNWIDSNKPKYGVNWFCAMDVAIRACNWVVAYDYFKDSKELTEVFRRKFINSLYSHGKHIKWNLEKSWRGQTSNHYLSNIAGLVYLGTFFRENKFGEKWLKFAVKELKKEMCKQVYEDGCDFEASTCYHRLVLELFFYSTHLLVATNDEFDGENHEEIAERIFGRIYTKKLYKMFDAVLHLLKPNGRMPQIGDNDSGQLFKVYPREVLDMRYLLAIGAVFFKEQAWKIEEFFQSDEDIAELLILYGEKGKNIWDSLEWNSLKNVKSKAFSDAGWYVMRDNKNYCIISCGPNGQGGHGGHTHNDKLSFELCVGGEDVIVDPGTYVYTPKPDMRNKFRSTASHNTVMVDGKEQNRFDKHSLFRIRDKSAGRCILWESGEEYDIFIGEHDGYKRLGQAINHQREIKFYKKEGKLEIKDRFEGEGEHELQWNLILSPEFKGEVKIASEKLQSQKYPSYYSPEYGIITNTMSWVSALKAAMPIELKFWIQRRDSA